MRPDGKKIKNPDPMYAVAAHLMTKRSDAHNEITIDIPVEPMEKYIHKLRNNGQKMSHMALILAAYIRTVSEFHELNRFVVNKTIYARTEFSVGMVVLKAGQRKDETMGKMYFEMDNTIFDVQNKIEEYVSRSRQPDDSNGMDKAVKILNFPGVLRFGVNMMRWLDKHGWMPKLIVDASPFHNSLVITNLASIRTNHIYHHCYDFGTVSVFLAMGNMREVPKRVRGEIVFEKCLPMGIVMDERICTGSYFALAFQRFKEYCANPELLEQPPKEVIQDYPFKERKAKKNKKIEEDASINDNENNVKEETKEEVTV